MNRRLSTLGRHAGALLAATVLWLAAAVPALSADPEPAEPGRTVAIGDVHGAHDELVSILRESGLVNEETKWVGGSTTLVQLGDLLDRGTKLREVLDLLMRLEDEAPRAGGRVIVLLGNHETMNLLGITRDVNRDAYAEFADEQSVERQAAALAAFRRFWRRRMSEVGFEAVFTDEATEQWLELHPPGFVEYSEALGPDGRYGAWLRGRPAAVVLGETLFIHGGYGPSLAGMTVDAINERVASELATFDETHAWMVSQGLALPWSSAQELIREAQRELDWIGAQAPGTVPIARRVRAQRLEALRWADWYLTSADGPFVFRGLAHWDEAEYQGTIGALLEELGVKRQVVGHNPQRTGRISSRFQGQVLLIDTGMLASVYGGQPSALEIDGDRLTAIYLGERHALTEDRTGERRE